MNTETNFDAVIVGAGLAGLVAANELCKAGKKVCIVEQEPEQSFGGQAFWSLGGLFMVDTPEQRRLGIKDSYELATLDWLGTAGFDRPEDEQPSRWAEAYLQFAAGEMRGWIKEIGMQVLPQVGWAERGGLDAQQHGNSVPRFHVVWGAGPGVVEPFEKLLREYERSGQLVLKWRHQVDKLTVSQGAVTGVLGTLLEGSDIQRGEQSSRVSIGEFELNAQSVIVASGGIGGNLELVQKSWPERLGAAPKRMLSGVPHHVDGRMIGITEDAGGAVINRDRMWHYTEGIQNWDSIWPNHGIRIIPGPSSLWLSAEGKRFPAPCFPGFDTLETLKEIVATGYDYSWFVTTRKIVEKEFALSGSEQNPDLTEKSIQLLLKTRLSSKVPPPVQAFLDKGEDFVSASTVDELVGKMNSLTGADLIDSDALANMINDHDLQIVNKFSKDPQIAAIHEARRYRADRISRVSKPHAFKDPKNGPLIAVRLNLLTRKTLGGIHTDLQARVLNQAGEPIPGLYAAGEAAGFGGGGVHGYRALEGTFLGGCLFSGRVAGRSAAAG